MANGMKISTAKIFQNINATLIIICSVKARFIMYKQVDSTVQVSEYFEFIQFYYFV